MRLSKIINYFFSASLLILLVSTSSINNNNHYIHDVMTGVCAGSGQVCVRADRSNKRVWFITSSPPPPSPSVPVNNGFSRIFSRPLYHPITRQSATLHLPPPHQTFRPLSSSFRRIFILRRFPFLSPYFGKMPPAVSCCRRAIKDNRNISVFPFSTLS